MNKDFSETVTNYFKDDYRERGKIKWQGYFLSDHTAQLKSETKKKHQVTKKLPQMPLDEIKAQLSFARINYLSITLQQDAQRSDGQLFDNIMGLVAGFSERGVVINGHHILLESIRAVVVVDE
ncbi:hypothetical protein LNP18_06510 [Leuconostoc citreum]|uniref:hypothetical protein n=1 Tax=Leuconostoc citreum TaxID=33964 RepID=UPI00200B7DA0|nr:hypothetical protein [Leuconostoc citreum]MCK8605756.1 hypothetical protein [Leuconostoc citreum]